MCRVDSQRGLAHAGHAVDGLDQHDSTLADRGGQALYLLDPADEGGQITGKEIASARTRSQMLQFWVVHQYLLEESAKFGAWLDSQLLDQRQPGAVIAGDRIACTPASI